ncbi:hypothetical protein GGH92_003767 [Coemansia sp. RSA 2673]|nr:hypothetical protein GGH92_003767 [Coemansia sp. RSA 2673]
MSPNSLNEFGIPDLYAAHVNGRRHPIQELQSMQGRETIAASQSLALGPEFQRVGLIDIFPIAHVGARSQPRPTAVQIYPTSDNTKQSSRAPQPIQSIQPTHESIGQTISADSPCHICSAISLAACDQPTHEIYSLLFSITAGHTNAFTRGDNDITLDRSQAFGAISSSLPEYKNLTFQTPIVPPEQAQSVAAMPSSPQSSSVVTDRIAPSNRRRALTSVASTPQRRRLPARFAHSNQLSFPPPVQDALLQILRGIRSHPYPSAQLIEHIQRQFGLTKKQIQNWFALRRYRYMTRIDNEGVCQWSFRNEEL